MNKMVNSVAWNQGDCDTAKSIITGMTTYVIDVLELNYDGMLGKPLCVA